MQVNLHSSDGNQFTSYTENSVTINLTEYHNNNILVTPTLIKNITFSSIDDLDDAQLAEILKYSPDLIIFGTGSQIKYPKNSILATLQKRQIGFEVMPIAALCRTFNYLIGEGRIVIGLLIF